MAIPVEPTPNVPASSPLDVARFPRLAIYVGMGQSLMAGVGHGNERQTHAPIAARRAVSLARIPEPRHPQPEAAFQRLIDTGLRNGAETPLVQAAVGLLPALDADEGVGCH